MLRKRHTKFARSLVCASIFATLFLFAGRATAQTYDYWNVATGGLWSTSSNWSSGTPSSSAVATFSVNPTSASQTVTVDVNAAVGAIQSDSAISFKNIAGTNIVLTVNGVTVNSIANTIINNTLPLPGSGTPSILTIANGTSNSLGLYLANAGGSVIQSTISGGQSSKAASITLINSVISGTGPLTFLGGGVDDLAYNASGANGGTLELGGANTFTGGMIIGSPNVAGVPDYGKQGQVQLDKGNSLPAGTYTVTVNNNSVLYAAITGTATSTVGTANTTYVINGAGNGWNSGALRVKGTSMTIPGKVVLGSDAVITTATAGNAYTFSGPITGAHQLQWAGAGTTTLTNSGNTWQTTQIGNGTVAVSNTGSFSTGSLNFAQTSSNVPTIIFNQPTQTINGLFGSIIGTAGYNLLTLNGTRLTINQTVNGSYGSNTNPLSSSISGTGSIVKTGSAILSLVSPCSLSGGFKVSAGTVLFTPLVLTPFTMPAPDTLDGGNIGTSGTLAGTTVSLNVLTVTNSSKIFLDSNNANRTYFLNSSSSVWTSGKTLTIVGWRGDYTGGLTGSLGQVFFGADATGLSAAQLAQVQFQDASGVMHAAVLLGTGELVPSPSITTTASVYGPFCNGVSNNVTVAYTTQGTLTGTYSVQ